MNSKTKTAIIVIAVVAIGATAAFGFGLDLDNPHQLIRLGAGERILIDCPRPSLLTFQPSKEASAAIVQCADGGPGFMFLQPY